MIREKNVIVRTSIPQYVLGKPSLIFHCILHQPNLSVSAVFLHFRMDSAQKDLDSVEELQIKKLQNQFWANAINGRIRGGRLVKANTFDKGEGTLSIELGVPRVNDTFSNAGGTVRHVRLNTANRAVLQLVSLLLAETPPKQETNSKGSQIYHVRPKICFWLPLC